MGIASSIPFQKAENEANEREAAMTVAQEIASFSTDVSGMMSTRDAPPTSQQ